MFTIVISLSRFDEKLPLVLQSAAILVKFLYNMVLDTFDRYIYCTCTLLCISIKKDYIVKINICIKFSKYYTLIKIYFDFFFVCVEWYLKD